MSIVSHDVVATKFREARVHLRRLGDVKRVEEFYATANALVTSARSVLYVAQHQFGWKERPRQQAFNSTQEQERKLFDKWFESCAVAQAVLAHPLAADRHEVIHRSGQAGFVHVPKPGGGGMAVNHGTPFKQAHWFTRRGLGGLPLQDDNVFYYLDASGTKYDAVPYAEAFLATVEQFVVELAKRPWL